MDDLNHVVIDTGSVRFPAMNIHGEVSFFLPFHMDLAGNMLEHATAQPLCRVDHTFFFVAIEEWRQNIDLQMAEVFGQRRRNLYV